MVEKKRICIYINTLFDGGAQRAAANIANMLCDCNNYEIVLLTSYRGDGEYRLDSGVRRLSIENQEIKQSVIKRNILRVKSIRSICKKEHIDVLIAFMHEPITRALIATVGLKTKVILSYRSDPAVIGASKAGRLIFKYLYPMADGAVFQSNGAKEWFPKKLQEKSVIISNPVPDVFYDIDRQPVKNRIVTCGRLHKVKNHRMLIEAFDMVQQEIDDAQLFIYGEGELREELQTLINSKNLQSKVFLPGNVEDVASVYSQADLFVLTSDHEGMPNALMEAMAAGVPCIATDCPSGGVREVLDGEFLLEVGNEIGLANEVVGLLCDSEVKDEISHKLKNRSDNFRIDAIKEQWLSFIENVSN